jgi:hypothetical protein
MRIYSRLLATATDAGASKGPFRPAPAALLPPIPLYRTILRTHRKKLPVEQRLLGDMYVKAEFRAHKDIDNPVQIVSLELYTWSTMKLTAVQIGFLSEWQMYAQAIEGDTWKGEKMDKAKIDKMSGMRFSHSGIPPY